MARRGLLELPVDKILGFKTTVFAFLVSQFGAGVDLRPEQKRDVLFAFFFSVGKARELVAETERIIGSVGGEKTRKR